MMFANCLQLQLKKNRKAFLPKGDPHSTFDKFEVSKALEQIAKNVTCNSCNDF